MSTSAARTPPPLEADAFDTLVKVQRAFQSLVNALPRSFERPSQLQHFLGLDAKVAWKIFKIATAKDPLAAAPHVPGRLLMRRIGEAALQKGAPRAIVDSAQSAIDEFETVVKQHASTRTAFKSIVATMADDESVEGLALQQRHAAFNVNSHLWGKQIDLQYTQAIFVRSDEQTTATCIVNVKNGLQLLRADASNMVAGYINTDGFNSNVQPLEPQAASYFGSPLLPSFCTKPVPELEIEQRYDGWQYSVLKSTDIGRRGAVDLAFGQRVLADTIGGRHDGKKIVVHGMQVLTPTAVGVLEFLVHRPTFPTARPQFAIFGDQWIGKIEKIVDSGRRLPAFGVLQNLGSADRVVTPPHVYLPRYEEMQQHVFEKLGWIRSEFDLYRITLSYPILHTTPAIWFEV